MNINTKGTYTIRNRLYVLSIDYTYYYNTGTYEQPPEADMEITSVELNGMDITDFYWDYVDDTLHTEVWEYAQDNN
tara:strand:- start:63 stop:290 length:228 start_codon:yes stop_codon:yes gene_type:complete